MIETCNINHVNLNFGNLSEDENIQNFLSKFPKTKFKDKEKFQGEFESSLETFINQINLSKDNISILANYFGDYFKIIYTNYAKRNKISDIFEKNFDFLTTGTIGNKISNILNKGEEVANTANSNEYFEKYSPAKTRKEANDSFLNYAYGDVIQVKNYVKQYVLGKLVNSMFIHRNGNSIRQNNIVDSDIILNKHLREFKQELMDYIIKYEEYMGNHSLVADYKKLYDDEGKLIKDINFNNFSDIINGMSSEQLLNLYRERDSNNTFNRLKFDAYNAYTILNNFDSFLVMFFEKSIKFKKFGSNSGNNYSLADKSTNNITSWRDKEDQDIKKVTGVITRSIITTTPFYEFGKDTPIKDKYITFSDFTSVISKLNGMIFDTKCSFTLDSVENDISEYSKNALIKLKEDINKNSVVVDEFISLNNIINNIRLNPQKWCKVLFEVMSSPTFKRLKGSSVVKYLKDNDFNIIYSLNKSIFDSSNTSLNTICGKNPYLKNNYYGYVTQIIDSLSKVKFMQYYINEENVLNVRTLLDQKIDEIRRRLEEDINYSRGDLSKYKIETPIKEELNNLTLVFHLSENESITISRDNFSVKGINLNQLQEIFFKNNGDKKQYTNITNFINTFLKIDITNTDFCNSLKLNYVSPNLFEKLFNTAASVARIKYINELFIQLKLNNDSRIINNQDVLAYFEKNNKPELDNTTNLLKSITKKDVAMIRALAKAKAEIQGFTNSSVVKDGEGNTQSNIAFSRLYGKLGTQFQNQCKAENSIIKDCLLMKNDDIFKDIYTAKEFKDIFKTTQHTDFTVSDFAYLQIVKDYIGGLYNKNTNGAIEENCLAIYPCVNSDKKTIARILINTLAKISFKYKNIEVKDTPLQKLNNSELRVLILSEFSQIYTNMFNNITSDLFTVLGNLYIGREKIYKNQYEVKQDYLNNFSKLNGIYGNNTVDVILEQVKIYNNALRTQSNTAKPIALTDQIHFITNKNGTISASVGLLQNLYRFTENEIKDSEGILSIDNVSTYGLLNDSNFWKEKHNELIESWLKDNILIDLKKSKQPEIKKLRELLKNYPVTDGNVKIKNWISNSNKLVIAKYKVHDAETNTDTYYDITDKTSLNIYSKLYDILHNTERFDNESDFDVLKRNGTFILNPMIENYNYFDYLFSQEFMIATVGTYLAHPNKNKQASTALEIIAGNYQAQSKRNVSNTAQMQQFQLNLLNGIPSIYNISCVKDIFDTQLSFSGETDSNIKPLDGATIVNPFIVYLENNSLGGQSVGVHKKNFSHFYDEHTGTGGIIKTAGFGLTNEWMRDCRTLQVVMKNMTNRVWDDMDCTKNILVDYNGNSNILKLHEYESKPFEPKEGDTKSQEEIEKNIEFSKIFRNHYYYKSGSNYYKATLRKPTLEELNALKNSPNQYTQHDLDYMYIKTYVKVSNNGKIYSEVINGTLQNSPINTENVIIDSNYKLWNALGGINSCSFEEGVLNPSEISISKVVNIINSIGEKTNSNAKVKTQEDLYQPLKHSDIHYIVTEGAIKQGASNMNPSSAYFEETDLNYMQIHMNHSGIQLDKEHGADKEALSLMTQVINACSSRGFTLEQADVLYQALKYNTTIRTQEFHDIFSKIYSGESIDSGKIRNLITKIIINSIEFSSGNKSLIDYMASNLVEAAKRGEINYSDEIIAGSKNGVYNKIVSILTVYFNKAGIKIKTPGVLAVMTPSYELFKLYKGKKLSQYDEDVSKWEDERIYNTYDLMFDKTYVIKHIDTDISEIVRIKKFSDYEKVKKALVDSHKDINIQVLERVSAGYNLPSYNVKFEGSYTNLKNKQVTETFQLYDLDIVKALFKIRELETPSKELKEIINNLKIFDNSIRDFTPKDDFDTYKKAVIKKAMKKYQQTLNILSGKSSNEYVLIDGKFIKVDKSSTRTSAYGLAMSKNFATSFGLKLHDQISDIKNDEYFFTKKLIKNSYINNLKDNCFSVKLTKLNGNHIYLTTFDKVPAGFTEKNIKKQHDIDGSVYCLNESGDGSIKYQMSSNNDKIYKNKDGIEVIVTDNLDFYINNESYNDIFLSTALSEKELVDILSALRNSYNKVANALYNSISSSNIESIKDFMNDRKACYDYLNTYTNDYKQVFLSNDSEKKKHLDFIQYLGKTIKTSWEKSLDVVAARIPAQSMQSFMPMEIVAYVDSDVNVAYVNTSQIWLQGSDYDIDAVSLATVDIDNNGIMQLWSLYANTSTLKDINEAIKYLPFNTKNTFKTLTTNSDNLEECNALIEKELNFIKSLIDKGALSLGKDLIKGNHTLTISSYINNKDLADFLKYDWVKILDSKQTIQLSDGTIKVNDLLKMVEDILNKNNEYLSKINSDKLMHIVNNRVQTSMYNIINDPINLIQAQTSVDATTGPLKDKSNESIEAKSLLKATPGNAINKMEGVVSNQVGRKAIGICATGLKAFFAATQHYNTLINNGNYKEALFNLQIGGKTYNALANLHLINLDNVDKNSDQYKEVYGIFNQDSEAASIFMALLYNLDAETQQNTINALSNNPEEGIKEAVNILRNVENSGNDAAVILSALLSLATDNAKELALSKLNAGEKTLGMYIFGISIGMEFEDIANIMMSNTALTLTGVMEGSPFNGINRMTSINQALNYFKGVNLHSLGFSNKVIKELSNIEQAEEENGSLFFVKNGYYTGDLNNENDTIDLKVLVERCEKLTKIILNKSLDNKQELISLLEFMTNYAIQKNSLDNSILEDLDKLYRGAEEFKLLGRLLSLNQGIKTNDEDIHSIIEDFETLNITARALNPNKDSLPNEKIERIDLGKFVFNKEYQKEQIEIYESLKYTVNIPAILASVPHFSGYLEMLALDNELLNNYTVMYRKLPDIINYGNNTLGNANKKMTVKKARFLLSNCIRDAWLRNPNNKFNKFTIKKGSIIDNYKFMNDTEITLGTSEANLLFKSWVEEIVIPNIRTGFDGNINNIYLRNNSFIQDLQPIVYDKTPDGNAIINQTESISLLPNDEYEQTEFDRHLKDFLKLKMVNYNGTTPLINILYLYNLIAFNDMVGQASWNKLFDNLKSMDIIQDYYKYIRNLDINSSKENNELDVEDSVKNIYLAQRANPYTYGFAKIIKVVNPKNKKIVLAKKITNEEKKEVKTASMFESIDDDVRSDVMEEFSEVYFDDSDALDTLGENFNGEFNDLGIDFSDELSEEFNNTSKEFNSRYYKLIDNNLELLTLDEALDRYFEEERDSIVTLTNSDIKMNDNNEIISVTYKDREFKVGEGEGFFTKEALVITLPSNECVINRKSLDNIIKNENKSCK